MKNLFKNRQNCTFKNFSKTGWTKKSKPHFLWRNDFVVLIFLIFSSLAFLAISAKFNFFPPAPAIIGILGLFSFDSRGVFDGVIAGAAAGAPIGRVVKMAYPGYAKNKKKRYFQEIM